MIAIDQDRFARITSLYRGAHAPNDTHMCVMEAVAWVTHKEWSDFPPCVCPVIAAFLRSWNDGLPTDADRVRLLKPLIPHVVNTKGSVALEQRRAAMAADWLIRVQTPAWLRLAGLNKHADALADLPEITDFAQCASTTLAACDAARTAWNAVRTAAWNAAKTAALDACDATRSAAWTACDAAWTASMVTWAAWAAWDAACGAACNAARAATWDAARAAAWDAAWEALAKTKDDLQQSALALLHRMIAA